jgi:hypothetical protein
MVNDAVFLQPKAEDEDSSSAYKYKYINIPPKLLCP